MSSPAESAPPEEQEQISLEQQSWWQRLRVQSKDIATFGALAIVGIYLLYSVSSSVYQNYQSKKEIGAIRTNITTLELEKERLQSLLVYYNTKSYQEIELRRRLLLKKPGETVVALRGDHPLTESQAENDQKKPAEPAWQQWYDYYFSSR